MQTHSLTILGRKEKKSLVLLATSPQLAREVQFREGFAFSTHPIFSSISHPQIHTQICVRARVFVFKIYVFVRYFIFWSDQTLEHFL